MTPATRRVLLSHDTRRLRITQRRRAIEPAIFASNPKQFHDRGIVALLSLTLKQRGDTQ
jgi:hypothetical protein